MSREVTVALTCVVVAICMTLFTIVSYLKDATLEDIRVDAYKLFLKAENGFRVAEKASKKWNGYLKPLILLFLIG